jgi:hypothetical protein
MKIAVEDYLKKVSSSFNLTTENCVIDNFSIFLDLSLLIMKIVISDVKSINFNKIIIFYGG